MCRRDGTKAKFHNLIVRPRKKSARSIQDYCTSKLCLVAEKIKEELPNSANIKSFLILGGNLIELAFPFHKPK